MEKVFVISFQKSGTYLVSEILGNLGYNKTLIHVNKKLENTHQKYDNDKLEEIKKNYKKFSFNLNAKDLFENLNDDQFAVGHIFYTQEAKKLLINHKKILMIRNGRNCLISMMRFLENNTRYNINDQKTWIKIKDKKEKLITFLQVRGFNFFKTSFKIMPWLKESPLVIRFENLVDNKKNYNELLKISDFLNLQIINSENVLNQSLKANTVTKSKSSVNFDDYWSTEAENIFNLLGGKNFNEILGYK